MSNANRVRKMPTEEEMQRVYEEEFLPLIKADLQKSRLEERNKRREDYFTKRKPRKKVLTLKQQRDELRAEKLKEQMLKAKKERKRLRKLEEKSRQEMFAKLKPITKSSLIPQINLGDSSSEGGEEEEVDENLLGIERSRKHIYNWNQKLLQQQMDRLREIGNTTKVKDFDNIGDNEIVITAINPVEDTWSNMVQRSSSIIPRVTEKKEKKKKVVKTLHLSEFMEKYDDLGYPECKTILTIGWKTKHLPAGKGVKERLNPREDFSRLNKIKDWRKKLTDTWVAHFKLDGKTWPTVLHYVEGIKFRGSKFMDEYTVESGSDISRNAILAKFAASKSGMYKNKLVRPRNVRMIRNYNADRAKYYATRAQIIQNPHLLKILEDTGDACIFTQKSRMGPRRRAVWLEEIRREIRNDE